MPAAHGIGSAAHAQAELRHPERLSAVLGVLTAKPHDLLHVGAQLGGHAVQGGDHIVA